MKKRTKTVSRLLALLLAVSMTMTKMVCASAEETDSNSWTKAYMDLIDSQFGESTDYEYSLVYIDSDDIPELAIHFSLYDYYLYTYKNGTVSGNLFETVTDIWNTDYSKTEFKYYPYENRIQTNVRNKADTEPLSDGTTLSCGIVYFSISEGDQSLEITDSIFECEKDNCGIRIINGKTYDSDSSEEDKEEGIELYSSLWSAYSFNGVDLSWPEYNYYDSIKQQLSVESADYGDAFTDIINDSSMSDQEKYDAAYELETENFSSCLEQYMASQDDYVEYINEETAEALAEGAEAVYQAVDSYDSNIKDVAAISIGNCLGWSTMSSYLISDAAGEVLDTDELGTAIREGITYGAVGLMNWLLNSQTNEQVTSASSLDPIQVGENYALVSTYGTIGDIISECENQMNTYIAAVDTRAAELEEESSNLTDSSEITVNQARRDALAEEHSEFETIRDTAKEEFLGDCGITEDSELMNSKVSILIGKDGAVYCSFICADDFDCTIDDNGNFSLRSQNNWGFADQQGYTILDKNANIIYTSTDNAVEGYLYSDITAAGTVFRQKKESDFDNGQHTILQLVDLEENILAEFDGNDFSFYVRDTTEPYVYELKYRTLDSENVDCFIDVQTGKTLTGEEFNERKEANAVQITYPEGVDSGRCEILNDQYYLCRSDYQVYDYSGKLVADLSAGQGVDAICYSEKTDHYLIVSNSGWYYTTDNNFERILEPIEIKYSDEYLAENDYDDGIEMNWSLCPYGLFTMNPDGVTDSSILYDETGTAIFEFAEMSPESGSGISGWTDYGLYDYICGCYHCGWVNLNTQEVMTLSQVPENIKQISLFEGSEEE